MAATALGLTATTAFVGLVGDAVIFLGLAGRAAFLGLAGGEGAAATAFLGAATAGTFAALGDCRASVETG